MISNQTKYKKLRVRMFEKGITQAALAEKIGISVQGLGLKLNGKRQFTLPNIKAICPILEIPSSEIAIFFDESA